MTAVWTYEVEATITPPNVECMVTDLRTIFNFLFGFPWWAMINEPLDVGNFVRIVIINAYKLCTKYFLYVNDYKHGERPKLWEYVW
jgi:hypothetical protein